MAVSKPRVLFMENYFSHLPTELQNLIMSKTYRIPKPRFRKGQYVMYTEDCKAELRKYLSEARSRPGGPGTWHLAPKHQSPQPLGRLLVYTEPRFDWSGNEWEYNYEYGQHRLARARESSLQPVSHVGGLTTMHR